MKKIFLISCLGIFSSFILLEALMHLYFSFYQNYYIEMWKYAGQLKTESSAKRSHQHIAHAQAVIMSKMVKINSLGLRNEEVLINKKNNYRILLLGDSITFGFGVDLKQTFSKILQSRFKNEKQQNVEVINAGVGNYNTAQELAFYEENLMPLKPDEIILCFFINDLENIQHYTNNDLTRHSMVFALLSALWRNALPYFRKNQNYLSYYQSLYSQKNLDQWESLMAKFKKEVDHHNIEFKVLLIPEIHQLKPYPFTREYSLIENRLRDLHINFVNALSWFDSNRSVRDYWVAKDDTHPNERGHEVLARALWEGFYVQKVSPLRTAHLLHPHP